MSEELSTLSYIDLIKSAQETAGDMISAYESNKDDDCIKDSFDDEKYIAVYYGNVLDLNPSGKYYMPWTSNQTEDDVDNDTVFWEEVEKVLSASDLWVESGEGDALDIFICGNIPVHFCKNCKWMDKDEWNLRFEICRCYKPQNIQQYNNVLRFDVCKKESLACYYYVERDEINKDDYKDTSEWKAGNYL
jgi:hypothetical protein